MVRVLSDRGVEAVLDLSELLDVVADAFRAQRDGRVERPDRPHFPAPIRWEPVSRCRRTFTVQNTTRRN